LLPVQNTDLAAGGTAATIINANTIAALIAVITHTPPLAVVLTATTSHLLMSLAGESSSQCGSAQPWPFSYPLL